MDVQGLDLKPEENVVKARGELSVFVLYGAEDTEAPVQWLEYSLPFPEKWNVRTARRN
ncbi:MAG: DUF3794 domain-containing protein [Blautia sp.]